MGKQHEEEDESIDAFLNHSTKSKVKTERLDWKDDGFAEVWLHTKLMPTPVWQHQLPFIVPIKDNDTKKTINFLWSRKFVCHEHEDVLKRQFRRDDAGLRTNPPEKCGLCKLSEFIREAVDDGDLDWKDVVFKFEGKGKNKKSKRIEDVEQEIHAGGFTNMFGKRDMTDEEKKELKEAGIYLSEAWKENATAKASYIFAVVDNNDIDAGVKVTTEAALLGDKVKTAIADRMKSKGREEGNPAKNPFCLRWEFNDDEQEFSKKYHALVIEKEKLTDEIEDLITGEKPDISRMTEPFNQKTIRTFLEAHWVPDLEVPWDDFFGKAGKKVEEKEEEDEEEPVSEEKPKRSAKTTKEPEKPTRRVKKDEEEEEEEPPPKRKAKEPAVEMVACDNKKCGKPMGINWNRCPECDTEYEGDDLIDPPAKKEPERVKRVTRSTKEEPKKEEKKSARRSSKKDEEEEDDDDDQDAEIPF